MKYNVNKKVILEEMSLLKEDAIIDALTQNGGTQVGNPEIPSFQEIVQKHLPSGPQVEELIKRGLDKGGELVSKSQELLHKVQIPNGPEIEQSFQQAVDKTPQVLHNIAPASMGYVDKGLDNVVDGVNRTARALGNEAQTRYQQDEALLDLIKHNRYYANSVGERSLENLKRILDNESDISANADNIKTNVDNINTANLKANLGLGLGTAGLGLGTYAALSNKNKQK